MQSVQENTSENAPAIHASQFTGLSSRNGPQFIIDNEEGRFTLDDGIQPVVTLVSPYREVLAATFYKFLQDNIGESLLIELCFANVFYQLSLVPVV